MGFLEVFCFILHLLCPFPARFADVVQIGGRRARAAHDPGYECRPQDGVAVVVVAETAGPGAFQVLASRRSQRQIPAPPFSGLGAEDKMIIFKYFHCRSDPARLQSGLLAELVQGLQPGPPDEGEDEELHRSETITVL